MFMLLGILGLMLFVFCILMLIWSFFKKNKSMRKKSIIGIVAGFFAFIIGVSLDGPADADESSNTTQNIAEEEINEDEESSSNEPEVVFEEDSFNVGDEVKVRDMKYIVHGHETAESVGGEFLSETAQGIYFLVDITVVNESNEAVTVDSDYFKLISGDKSFEADTIGSIYANQDSDGNETGFFLETINPDISIRGKVAFDVSDSFIESTDKQIQVATGYWGTETEIVNLD